jgi:histone H3/H4
MDEQRPSVKEENPDAKIGELAKIIGAKWKELDEESKVVYVEQANKAKEAYLKQLALFKKHHPNAVQDSESKKKSGDELELTFPLARIRKIARLDPEVNGISKEAATLLTYAAELFTEKMGQEAFSMAQIQKRRKLILQDVVDVTSMKDKFHFLKEDMNDFVKQYKAKELEENGGNGNLVKKQKVMSEKALSAVSNTKPLTSFFQKK